MRNWKREKDERINNLCLETAKQKHQLCSIRFHFFQNKSEKQRRAFVEELCFRHERKRTLKSFYIFCDQKQCFLKFHRQTNCCWFRLLKSSLVPRWTFSQQTLTFPLCSHLPAFEGEIYDKKECEKDHFSIIFPSWRHSMLGKQQVTWKGK